MKHLAKQMLSFLLVIVCALTVPNAFYAFAGNIENEMYIRVGLYYGSSTAGQYKMECPDGFDIVAFNENTYDLNVIRRIYAVNAVATANGSTVTVSFADGTDFSATAVYIAPISPDASRAVISVPSGKKFCGMLRFTGENSRLTVVNILKLEDYIKGVLPNEVPSSWELECLKASAVAARTFAISSIGGKHRSAGFDVCNTTHCQVFSGTGSEKETTNEAIDLTRTEILSYNGKVIEALYHSSSGGCTESAAGAWGGTEESHPYLTVIETPFEKYEEYPNGKWTADITTKELFDYVNGKSAYAGKLRDNIAKIEYTPGPSGYIRSVTLYDPYGNSLTVTTSASVYSLFSKFVNSSNFTLTMDGKSYININGENTEIDPTRVLVMTANGIASTSLENSEKSVMRADGLSNAGIVSNGGDGGIHIDGKGFGHGVGLSQYGSRELAKMGKLYNEILATYYPGTLLTTIDEVYGE